MSVSKLNVQFLPRYQALMAEHGVPLRYRHLTGRQKAALVNGCGSKGGWIKPPQLRFAASCRHHDFNYWIGGTEKDRAKADRQFLEAMLEDASALGLWTCSQWDAMCHAFAARIYWLAVRLFGWRAFHYGKQRSWEDLR